MINDNNFVEPNIYNYEIQISFCKCFTAGLLLFTGDERTESEES
jgi:hypothetical protein